MRLVIIALTTIFVGLVITLVVLYRPEGNTSRAAEIDQAFEQPVVVPQAPAATPATTTADPAKPAEQTATSATPAAGSAATEPAAADAASSLKEEHLRENVTQFDRALDFLAPAAAAPMIENPIATAAATAALPESLTAEPVPVEAKKWRGAVLVPKNMLLATAHTSKVRIPRIEAHPLDDGNVRIWARIQNPSSAPIRIGTTCTFRYAGQVAGASRGFLEVEIPAGGYYDADYLSPHSGVETYTILVRAEN